MCQGRFADHDLRLQSAVTAVAGNKNSQQPTIHFDFAVDRGSLLVRARLNGRAAVLIADTGSSHTIWRPSAAGLNLPWLHRVPVLK